MLIIRKEQIEVLDRNVQEQFEKGEIARLRAKYPEKTQHIDEAQLCEVVQMGITSAEKYEVTDEVDVKRYLDFMFRYGYDFDTNPDTYWAREILTKEYLSGTGKMNLLQDYELFELSIHE